MPKTAFRFILKGCSMFKTAFRFVWSRKKSSAMLVAILALSMALMLVISPMFDAVADSIFELYANRYGEHHGVITNLNEEKMERLVHEDAWISRLGVTKNYGSWQITNASANITLGYFDETAFSLGRLRLLEGRLPEADDEIVLERNAVLYKCKKGAGVGDRLPLASGGAEKEFTIVGVIADYTGYWDTFMDESVIAGYNDFPQALTTDQALGSNESNLSCLLYLRRDNISNRVPIYYGDPMEGLVNSAEGGGQIYYYNYFYNSSLYKRVVEGKLADFKKFQQAFRYAILGGACLTVFAALSLYLNDYKRGYSLLYMLGASRY